VSVDTGFAAAEYKVEQKSAALRKELSLFDLVLTQVAERKPAILVVSFSLVIGLAVIAIRGLVIISNLLGAAVFLTAERRLVRPFEARA